MSWRDHLYIATNGELFKIGVTANPEKRGLALRPGRIIKVWQRPWAFEIERSIKGIFAADCVCGTEWFAVTRKEMFFEVQRTVRIYDAHNAILAGVKPARRRQDGEPQYVPPFELDWLRQKVPQDK